MLRESVFRSTSTRLLCCKFHASHDEQRSALRRQTAFRGLKRDPECRHWPCATHHTSAACGDVFSLAVWRSTAYATHTWKQVKPALGSARRCRSSKEIKESNAWLDLFLPGGRVGRVCPDRPGLQPTTIRPGAADPHRLQDSPSASCQRRPSDGPRISTGTDEIASMFEF